MRYWVSSAPKIGGMSQSGRRQNRQNRVNNVELFHVFRLFRTPPPSWSIRCFWSTRGKYLQQSWKCFRSFAPLGIYSGEANLSQNTFQEISSFEEVRWSQNIFWESILISEYISRKWILGVAFILSSFISPRKSSVCAVFSKSTLVQLHLRDTGHNFYLTRSLVNQNSHLFFFSLKKTFPSSPASNVHPLVIICLKPKRKSVNPKDITAFGPFSEPVDGNVLVFELF